MERELWVARLRVIGGSFVVRPVRMFERESWLVGGALRCHFGWTLFFYWFWLRSLGSGLVNARPCMSFLEEIL